MALYCDINKGNNGNSNSIACYQLPAPVISEKTACITSNSPYPTPSKFSTMMPAYIREEMSFTRGQIAPRLFMSAEEIQMPKTRGLKLWRAYIEDGNRVFCEHETAILKRYVRRITGVHKRLLFPERFGHDRETTIDLWNRYIEARQTPAEALERSRSIARYKARNAALILKAARKKLFGEIEANAVLAESIRRRRQGDEVVKNFDFSRGRLSRRPARNELPLQVLMGGKRHLTIRKSHKRLTALDDTPIAPQFSFNFAIQKPPSFLLRTDPNLGRYMVKQGRESPLRQSVSLHQVDDSEIEIQSIQAQVGWSIDALQGQIAGFERRNLAHSTRDPQPNSRRLRRSRINGL